MQHKPKNFIRSMKKRSIIPLSLLTVLMTEGMSCPPQAFASPSAINETAVVADREANDETTNEQSLNIQDKKLDAYNLDEVIVTASRIEKKISEVPANVSVITEKELEKHNYFSIREALQSQAGIYVDPTALTKDGVQIRGFGSGDILVMVDGQTINDSFTRGVNWDSVPMDQIERIEIVRGAGSSLYGGHAVAGMINIITKQPKLGEGLRVSTNVSFGSNNTWKRGISVWGDDSKKLTFRVSYGKRSTDGYPGYYATLAPTSRGTPIATNNLQQLSDGKYVIGSRGRKSRISEDVSAILKYNFDDMRSLSYSYMHNEYQYSYHDPFSYVYDATGKHIFNGVVQTQNGDLLNVTAGRYLGYIGERASNLHQLQYVDKENEWQVKVGYLNTYKDGYSSATSSTGSIDYDGVGGLSLYPSERKNVDIQKHWQTGIHSIVAGGAYMIESLDYRNYDLANWRDHNSISKLTGRSAGDADTIALFVQDEIKFSDKFKTYAGVRFDRYTKKNGESLYDDGTKRKTYGETSFTSWSPKVALSYSPTDKTEVFLSYGHSFNPPDLSKLYRWAGDAMSSYKANPALEPETANTWEFGVKHKMGSKATASATFFRIKTDDVIRGATIDGFKAYYNLDQGMTKGVELEGTYQFGKGWNAFANYTFQRAEVTTNGRTSNDYNLPKHMFKIGMDYEHDKWNCGLTGQFVSARQEEDAATGEYNSEDAFFTLNAYVNYRFNKNISIQGTVDNLLNRKFFAGEATSGRVASIGLKCEF